MILFDIKEGAESSISGKCYVEPKTELIGESMVSRSLIEIICEEKPECRNKKCPELFDIAVDIIYKPFDIFKAEKIIK